VFIIGLLLRFIFRSIQVLNIQAIPDNAKLEEASVEEKMRKIT
jgi:hypothetical protein